MTTTHDPSASYRATESPGEVTGSPGEVTESRGIVGEPPSDRPRIAGLKRGRVRNCGGVDLNSGNVTRSLISEIPLS